MQRIPVIIIGAGQAGLAMSYCLTARGVEHTVLERGQVAERWRTERWDSLRLLTPNWMTRLPGWTYQGSDPNGFMTAGEFAGYLGSYAGTSGAPVETNVDVRAVRHTPWGYVVETSQGTRLSQAVVVATGHCDVPAVPAIARRLPASVIQVTPSDYRNPAMLPDGGVLVVGASATGVQIADELQRSGRQVSISVGRHTRLPRSYRGRDIWYWLEQIGVLDDPAASVSDLRRARAQPSFQLVGRPDGRTIDLGTLGRLGVQMLGRTAACEGRTLLFHDDLDESILAAHLALERLLARIDVAANAARAPWQDNAASLIEVAGRKPTKLDVLGQGIRTIVWATGFYRNYSWLKMPVVDASGELIHNGGVTSFPGLYALGLRFMRRRRSNFIDGVGRDAEDLTEAVLGHLSWPGRAAA